MYKNVCIHILTACVIFFSNTMVWAQIPFDSYGIEPWVEIQPGFTTNAQQELTLDLGGVGREALDIRAVLLNGNPLAETDWSIRLNVLAIRPSRSLNVGLNHIEVRYSHPLDLKHTANPTAHGFYVNYQPQPTSVTLSPHGELIVAGRPTFVVGAYRSGQEDEFVDALSSARDAGFNMVHDYHFEHQSGDDVEAYIRDARRYLSHAEQLGLGVFMGMPRKAVREYDEASLARIVAELSSEPALWMWYIMDEPNPKSTPIINVAQTYHLIKRLDPNHPAVVLANRPEIMLQYYAFCDLLWYDRYPIIASSDELRSLAPISAAVQYAQQVVGEKPMWPVLQAHDARGIPGLRDKMPHLPMPADGDHRPDESELRAQAHLAIANGVMGVTYYWGPDYWYSMREDTPGVWASLSKVLGELRELEPVLLSTQTGLPIHITGGNDKVLKWVRALDGRVYVGLVNTSSRRPSGELIVRPSFDVTSTSCILGEQFVQQPIDSDEVKIVLPKAGVVVLEFEIAK